MRKRGYPTDNFDQRVDDISVEHPEVVWPEGRGTLSAGADTTSKPATSRGWTLNR
jgi:hypothetical protein